MKPEEILQEISQIQRMVEGTIGSYEPHHQGRIYHNLSSYVGGKTTQKVRKDQIPALQRLIDEHRRFRKLMAQYEEAIIRRTREELGLPLKPQPQRPVPPPAASN